MDSFEEWMAHGIKMGWAGPPVCYTHDGLPMSGDEIDDFESQDPCIHIVRLYESVGHKLAVENEHSPSQWRNHYKETNNNE